MPIGVPFRSVVLLLSSCWLVSAASNDSQLRQDRAWKQYTNKDAGYCVSYPSRWIKAQGFQGVGISVTTGTTRYGLPIASLDVSAFPDEPATVEAKPISLSDDYETHLVGLKRFIRAEQIETLEERPLAVSGLNALFAKASYFDPKEKSDWIEEIVFTRHDGMTYRLELQSRAAAWQRFQPVFQHFVDSFQVHCGAH